MSPFRAARIRWSRLLLLFVSSFLVVWLILVMGMSQTYLAKITQPACPSTPDQRPPYTAVQLATADGIRLRGWWLAPQNRAVILLLPGNGGSRDAMLAEAELLARHGYGILTLESRNCAAQPTTLGYRETDDLLAMLDYALTQPDVAWTAALGFSAGGVAAIRAAARDQRIQAVVAQGNFYSLDEEIHNAPSIPFSLEWHIQQTISLNYRWQTGVWPAQVNPAADLPRIAPRPVLLIAGEDEAANNRILDQYQATGEPRQMWIVPAIGHGGYLQAQPEQYERIVVSFLDQARQNSGQLIQP